MVRRIAPSRRGFVAHGLPEIHSGAVVIRPLGAALVLCLLCQPDVAHAHPAPFSYLDLRLAPDGLTGGLTVHDLDAAFELKITDADALLDPAVARRHGPALAEILARRLHLRVDGRDVTVTLSDAEPVPDRQGLRFTLRTEGAAAPTGRRRDHAVPLRRHHQTFINVYEGDSLRHQAILDARHTTFTYYAGSWQGVGAVLGTFVPAGAYHIAIGPDHLLFLVGLLLLGGSLKRLGLIVTAFTLGHTVTLSLAVDASPGLSRPRRAATTASAASRLTGWPLTAETNSSRSSARSEASVRAVTVAVRGTSRSSAISPKWSPGPSEEMTSPSINTSISPLSTR